MAKMSIAKRWCFTINNPTDDDKFWEKDTFQKELVQYMVLQEERGEQGTLHWQGFIILKKREKLTWLKAHINERAHFEVTRGTNEEASDYCEKDDTYTGGLRVKIGSLPEKAKAGKANERLEDAAEELDIIKDGYKRPRDVKSMTLLCPGFISAYKELTSDILGPYRPELQILTLIGPPGCGKSFSIEKYFAGHGRCICGNNGVWFQNPLSDVMVFEEFCGQIMLQRMLQFLDPYPLALEVKGGMRPAMYNLVIITSNTPPNAWYKGDEAGQQGKRTDALLALWDRLGYSNGAFVPARTCGHYCEAPGGLNLQELREWFDEMVKQMANKLAQND